MCIIVDTNVFSEVFVLDPPIKSAFRSVRIHIDSKKSRLIFGGTKFETELKGHIKLLVEMRKTGKLVIADCSAVDCLEEKIKKNFPRKIFNDEHIIALTIISGAKLVCTEDGVLQSYLKNQKVYPKGFHRPMICTKTTPASVVPNKPFPKLCHLCK